MVIDLRDRGYDNIFILDTGSTYEPLLEWYSDMEQNEIIKLIPVETEHGQLSLWKDHIIEHFQNYPWIVYTDSDIALNPDTPKNFIEDLIDIAEHSAIKKVGLAIEINDLPQNELCDKIRMIESRYWKQRIIYKDKELYIAPLDTTFSIMDPKKPFDYQAIRVAGNFTCKHIPWYQNWNNLSSEEEFFINQADPKISTYTAHYNTWKNKK